MGIWTKPAASNFTNCILRSANHSYETVCAILLILIISLLLCVLSLCPVLYIDKYPRIILSCQEICCRAVGFMLQILVVNLNGLNRRTEGSKQFYHICLAAITIFNGVENNMQLGFQISIHTAFHQTTSSDMECQISALSAHISQWTLAFVLVNTLRNNLNILHLLL